MRSGLVRFQGCPRMKLTDFKKSERRRNGKWVPCRVLEMRSDEITFEELTNLADAVGHRDIDIRYEAGTADYSELTPGDPSSCEIIIWDPT